MDKKFELSYKDLLDKLLQVQKEMEESQKENNIALYRMLELDMYKLLELLEVNSCEYCQYNPINKNKKCDLEIRCQSYVLLKNLNITSNDITTDFEFVLKLL